VYLGDSIKDRQSETTVETGNTCISETVKSTVKTPTTNLGYKTTCRWKIVSASTYDSEWQLEISIWPPKPEIISPVELWQIAAKFQRHIPDFRWCPARQTVSQNIATTIDYQKLHDWRAKRLYCHFRLSLSQSPGISFFALGVVENPIFAVAIVILSVIVPDVYFRFLFVILKMYKIPFFILLCSHLTIFSL